MLIGTGPPSRIRGGGPVPINKYVLVRDRVKPVFYIGCPFPGHPVFQEDGSEFRHVVVCFCLYHKYKDSAANTTVKWPGNNKISIVSTLSD